MEQPFFPVIAGESHVELKLGETCVFCIGADRRKGEEGRSVLVFVTPRLL